MIFSLQSSVIHGHVGQSAALPFYHRFGFVTEHLDTVRLAAHPGHGVSTKQILSTKIMDDFLSDYLSLPKRQQITAFHTGYFGSAEQVERAADFIRTLREENHDMIYLLDPVFGDKGKAYVSQDIISAITTYLVPLANIITPNHFELSLLAGKQITSLNDAQTALTLISNCTAEIRLLTGLQNEEIITDLLVTKQGTTTYEAPAAKQGVSGAGDAFAALFLAHYLTGGCAEQALSQASATTHHMIAKSKSPLTLDVASGLELIHHNAAMR